MRQVRLYASVVAVLLIVSAAAFGKGGSSGGSKGGGSGHTFNPADHPRGPDGRFIPKGSGGDTGSFNPPTNPPPTPDPTTRPARPSQNVAGNLGFSGSPATTQASTRPLFTPVDDATRQRQREELRQQAERIKAAWDAQ